MNYTIDTTSVNTRTDWKHVMYPGKPQLRQEEQFPGIAKRFVYTGPIMPDAFVVNGFLEASGANADAAISALHALIYIERNRRGNGQTFTVKIANSTFVHCELADFTSSSRIIPIASSGTVKVKVAVTYQWRQLSV